MSVTTSQPRVYRVSELTREIQAVLESRFDFVWIEGEISNFRAPLSGHYYLVLKDDKAQIRAVMFRMQARYLKFTPENGMKVIAQGRIGVYAPRGEYQIILDYLEPLGVGALALAFEQLKKKLAQEGVFDEDRKRPLPFLPQKVAVITSPTGAAIRDFLKVIRRRFANIDITVVPVRVQGEGAAEDMVRALRRVNRDLDVEVIVLTRGGGSLEDLWAFNEESLAYAIRDSRIPVVSAVGHEVDLTIADLAADFRAPTPSAAAELLVAEKEALVRRLRELHARCASAVGAKIARSRENCRALAGRLKDPRRALAQNWMRVDELGGRLLRATRRLVADKHRHALAALQALLAHSPAATTLLYRQQVHFHRAALVKSIQGLIRDTRQRLLIVAKRAEDLSPRSALERGYSITLSIPERKVLREAACVSPADRVQVLLARGRMECRVESTHPGDGEEGSWRAYRALLAEIEKRSRSQG